MTAFATAQELRTYLDGSTLATSPGVDDEWIAQAEMILDMIGADIQSAARNRIIEGTTTAKLPGTWSRDLELPRRPIVSITSAEINGVVLAATGYEWNERSILRRWRFALGALEESEPPTPHDGAHWGGPGSTVTVVYSHGYSAETVPDEVKSLSLRVASRTIQNAGGVTQETLGPYSVSYGNVLAAGGTHLTDKEVRTLRRRFGRTTGTQTAGSL